MAGILEEAELAELRVLQRVLTPPVEPALESSREEEAVLFRDRGASSGCTLAVRFIFSLCVVRRVILILGCRSWAFCLKPVNGVLP